MPSVARTRRRRVRENVTLKNRPASLGDLFIRSSHLRFSEKVIYILHIFRVNKICFIVLSVPFAEGVEMVSVFTSPHRIDIWFVVFWLVAVPGGYGLCVG